MLKRFLNAPDKLVSEAIDGLLRSSQGAHLARLDAGAGINVVLQKHVPPDRVAVISGGGSGHEPAHAGFVGRGMLTAAVCGAVFASPGIDAILSAIIAVTGPAGCLLIVKNYTGDRLNFGIAAEQARALGYKVALIIVGDDIALGQNARARGIAGTILIHKIAGYHAERGASLEEVTHHAEDASRKVRSLGLALTDCNVYDGHHQDRLGPHEAELGLGVHGEAGAEKIPLASLDQLMHRVVGRLETAITPGNQIVMINMLGAVPPLEACAIAASFAKTALAERTKWVIGPAPIMTSLDMVGFSLSLLPAEEAFVEALRAPVESSFWPGIASFPPVATVPAPELTETFTSPASQNAALETRLQAGLDALISARQDLNALDGKLGDGDAGSTFADAAQIISEAFPQLPFARPDALCAALGRLLARHSGGSSGALLSIMLTAAGREPDWVPGLKRGIDAMTRYGGAQKGDRTMLDALWPAITCLEQGGSLTEMSQAARKGADATIKMKAGAGRAAYVPAEHLEDVIDPGAEAVARFLAAVAAKD
ncbi:dihydroxyacetone kinase subunit DhaK [Candidatus Kirkpatrickella diaphorinae]|uniref:Dihydroxyacetone kinase subunit DhaK n=1 Tax=Candidatus Kirkpatrickella diaphorinae TaxID=2984322 RepID=A0ABY6GL87_9PROT|nr:dihydroxyacetone kinase subunit DhaK [Candidatus Kirkpatrickella diaphorinae]UYH51421.1 dihydroxyacetone kinase subunit DhaK [Candidatus Kirkpatrickella diaphorinae]